MRLLTALILILTLSLGNASADAKRRAARPKARTEQAAARKSAAKRSSGDVRREQKRTAGEIKQTQQQIDANKRETRRQLSRLAGIEADLQRNRSEIAVLKARIDSLAARTAALTDSIADAEQQLTAMRAAYARSLRAMRQRRKQISPIAFVMGAGSFSEAYRRQRYLRELSAAHATKARRVRTAADILAGRRRTLEQTRAEQQHELDRMAVAQNVLQDKSRSADTLVASLRRQGASLKRVLDEKRRQAAALDAELDRIIAAEAEAAHRAAEEKAAREKAAREKAAREKAKREPTPPAPAEQHKPATTAPKPAPRQPALASAEEQRALTGSFASNKGRLLFPVSGKYRIVSHFGRTSHPDIPGVEIQNSGIDIEAASSALARAVFDGEVTSVFRIDGYQNIVILRHGEYLTVYAGLDRISVRKGEKVRAAQPLGHIFADPDNDGRAVLHFELRREKQKLNPAEWVK